MERQWNRLRDAVHRYLKQSSLLRKVKEKDRMMKANVFLEQPKIILAVNVGAGVFLFFLCNFLINTFIRFCRGHFSDCVEWKNIFRIEPELWLLYLFMSCVLFFAAVRNLYLFRNAFRDPNMGQKGTSRFTTFEEIRQQYPAVPEHPEYDKDGNTVRIPGNGGLPVACKDGLMYLDGSATNALILAITRAGKGELFSLRMLDSYSRSEKQPSLVILDMKFDLRKMCTRAFKERGYKVLSINLEEPLRGIGYNPLYLITRCYRENRESEAELLSKAFAYPHFAGTGGRSDDNSDFFLSNATSALTATIMAHTKDCLAQDQRENARRADLYIRKRFAYDILPDDKKEEERNRYERMKEKPFDVLVEELDFIPDEVKYEELDKNARKNNMASVLHLFSTLASEYEDKDTTQLDRYFAMRGRFDRAKAVYNSIEVSGDRTKGSIFSQLLTKLTQYTFGGMEQMTRESSFDPEELGFGEQPVALFLQVPFYDRSKDAAAVSFIDQIYQANARACVKSRGMKCERRVIFHLDEIAQFPPIENLDSKLSVCLGLNMMFNLIIQTDAQLTLKYGEAAKIIKGNCGNQVFLQTSEEETAKLFSSLLGNRTIVNVNRSGRRLSLDKSYTEVTEERPLLTARELMDLEKGENVILRTMYREDLNGRDVKPRPIFNSREEGRAYWYRYQYLKDVFPDADTVTEEELGLPYLEAVAEEEMYYDERHSFEAVEWKYLDKWYRNSWNEKEKNSEVWQTNMERYQQLRRMGLYEWDNMVCLTEYKDSDKNGYQIYHAFRLFNESYGAGIPLEERIKKAEIMIRIAKSGAPIKVQHQLIKYMICI